MVEPQPTGARFRQRDLPGEDAGAFVRDQLNARPNQHEVIAEIDAPAERVKDIVQQWGVVEPLDERTSRLIMRVDSFEWPAMVIGTVGEQFRTVQPAEFGDYLRRMGTLFSRA